jgi:hypothetical protein
VTGFLSEIGSRLADRWAAALVVPGLLFLTVVTLAAWLGQDNALDIESLRPKINAIAADPASHTTGAVLLVGAGVLAASIGAGLAASVAGNLVERTWLLHGDHYPARAVRAWRIRKWAAAEARVREAQPPVLGSAIARRNAISLIQADRPTWIGDRLHALDERIWRAYDLDLSAAWPALWTLASQELRSDLAAAQDAFSSAARLTGWGFLYLVITPWWWPSALIAVITLIAGRNKARSATETLASLVEATVDLYGRNLAAELGLSCAGPLSKAVGLAITSTVRKDQTVLRHGQ